MSGVVVLIGHCGTGKSTGLEKMTGIPKGTLAGAGKYAVTKHQHRATALNGAFGIVDTPGQNALKDRLQDNMEVAMALNHGPVSMLLCTVKADTRLEAISEQILPYAERFLDFSDLLCIMVTHMDVGGRQWNEDDVRQMVQSEYGIDKVVFSGNPTPPEKLILDVQQQFAAPRDFSIDSENFLQYFSLNNNNFKVLRVVKSKVAAYAASVKEFQDQLTSWSEQKRADLVFRFNKYMTDQIPIESKSLADDLKWDFISEVGGMTVEQQCAHVANMSSQMKSELFKVRTIAAAYQVDAGVSVLRRCPHCGMIWGKWEGCEGSTTCGERPSTAQEYRHGVYHDFAFQRGPLRISEQQSKRASGAQGSGYGAGCGKPITWSAMEPVTSGDGWTLDQINGSGAASAGIGVTDVAPIGIQKARDSWEEIYKSALAKTRTYAGRAQIIAGGA